MKQNNYQGALQHPIHSGFNATSTAADVIQGIDLTGKVAIVTGGNTGIGLETTRVLAAAGARVIVPARDMDKAGRNLQHFPNVEIAETDLLSPESIDRFAENFLATGSPLHMLINNAGIMWVPLRRTSSGIESQLAVNFLAQFRLVARLWPALVKANGARVINVSSFGHQMAPFNFDDPNFENRPYETLQGYGQSKTACNLFTAALDDRAQANNVRAFSLHPGNIAGTELAREAPQELMQQMGFYDADGNVLPHVAAKAKTIPQGAATTVWCATSPMLRNLGGVYCENADVAELDLGIEHNYEDPATIRGVQPYSLDEASATRLWHLGQRWSGITFLSAPEK